MQALLRFPGNFAMSATEAKLPMNWDRSPPKCWDAFTQENGTLNMMLNICKYIDLRLNDF